jgi:hypothetical protein
MKTSLFSLLALGVAATMAGPAERAQAGEPMVLTDAQLDRVTAAGIEGEALATLVVNKQRGPILSPNTADNVDIEFGRAPEGTILRLELETVGTAISGRGIHVWDVSDPSNP